MRPTVAIYLRTYLGASMTFVHRQRAGVAERFRPLVWCNRLGPGKPPHDGIEVLPQTLPVRATRWLRRRAGGAWSRLSPGEIAQWQRRGEAEGVALIHAHFGPYGVEILPVARALGVPLVVTFHGFGSSVLLERPGYVRQLGPLFEHATVVAASEAKMAEQRIFTRGVHVHDVMVTSFKALSPGDTLGSVIDLLMAGEQQDFPVVDDGNVVGVLTRDAMMRGLASDGRDAPVKEFMHQKCDPAEEDEPLDSVFQRMRMNECSTLPVMRDNDLVGMLTLENVGEWIMIQSALQESRARREVANIYRES